MLTKKQISDALQALNDSLGRKSLKGEIGLVGGGALCLAFNAREATKDLDAIFAPTAEIRVCALEVASEFGLPVDWLNDAVKGYLPGEPAQRDIIWSGDNLTVWVPPANYLLAMKVAASRADTNDIEDIVFLAKLLKLNSAMSVRQIAEQFYGTAIPQRAHYILEELEETGRLKDQ